MAILAGTPSGLVDVERGGAVELAGQDVTGADAAWVVLARSRVVRRGRPAGSEATASASLTCVAAAPGAPGPEALVGTAGAHLLRGGDRLDPVEGFERADGRDEWYTPWGGPPDVRSVATAPDGTVLVNVHVGGIVRSADGGATWSPTIDIHADVHQVLALDGGRALAACAEGLATSTDGGASWTICDEGLHATYARSVAVAGGTVLLGVSSGPQGRQSAVYRRPLDGDGALEHCRGGLPDDLGGNVDTFLLAGAPDGSAALATPDGRVYASADEGTTWAEVASGLPAVRCLLLE